MPLAVQSLAAGPPSALEVREVPAQRPGPGEVLISVRTASVSFHDALIVADKYQIRPRRPFSPGGEVAGVVAAVGPGVRSVRPGQRVRAGMIYGGYREEVVAREGLVWPLVDGVPFESAFLGNYAIAYLGLFNRGELRKGERVLVLGAAGGLGLCAVELATNHGCTVVAAASSEEKLETCRRYGAAHCINYESEDLKGRLKALGGVDVVFDPVGGRWAETAARALRWGGRYLVLGFTANAIPRLPLNLLLLNSLDIRGVIYSTWMQKQPQEAAALLVTVEQMVREGKLRPHVGRVYPLEQAAQALGDILGRRVQGKVVLATAAHRGAGSKM
eukprot:TRINITY_DN13726_c0_g1_i1.p3 TRINITY_DN13726_c0_g1~~TRINITY_DN13726_c0_g1_i1.p3  ORF type:complete len:358 (+),score=116.59 TRINITY_DN13726_c0_g1_i1:82-1074(+)